jgi:hypothetical protein
MRWLPANRPPVSRIVVAVGADRSSKAWFASEGARRVRVVCLSCVCRLVGR